MNKNPLDELNSWLGESDDSNWTEYSAELVAKVVLSVFSKDQWIALKKAALQKPEYWQQRCVVSLGEERSPNSIEILKLFLEGSSYIDVKIMAIYELDWAEVEIEKNYAQHIQNVIAKLPAADVEPEITRLLKKAESAIK